MVPHERPGMDVLQTWVVVAVPGLLVAAALFVGRSRVRAWIGYGVLAALIVTFFVTPGGGASAAVVGAIAVVFVASGRGTRIEQGVPEHHEHRERFTVAP